ncbi:hypothetical protein LIA77_02599 [Sarocladium implicatum]|nr:hypothetical protein LIA77_02599 [Sarocladium implicatum]
MEDEKEKEMCEKPTESTSATASAHASVVDCGSEGRTGSRGDGRQVRSGLAWGEGVGMWQGRIRWCETVCCVKARGCVSGMDGAVSVDGWVEEVWLRSPVLMRREEVARAGQTLHELHEP